jgi:hypothetical protein
VDYSSAEERPESSFGAALSPRRTQRGCLGQSSHADSRARNEFLSWRCVCTLYHTITLWLIGSGETEGDAEPVNCIIVQMSEVS